MTDMREAEDGAPGRL